MMARFSSIAMERCDSVGTRHRRQTQTAGHCYHVCSDSRRLQVPYTMHHSCVCCVQMFKHILHYLRARATCSDAVCLPTEEVARELLMAEARWVAFDCEVVV